MKIKTDATGEEKASSVELTGTVTLFGFSPGQALIQAVPRTRAWRGARALAFILGGTLLTPVVGVIPPHAPWVAAALGFGFFFGVRKWKERFTLESLHARCPKCGGPLVLPPGTPLRPTHSVSCDGCHHDSQLNLRLPQGAPSPEASQDSGDAGAAGVGEAGEDQGADR
jgi:hypothetical protein